MSNVTLQEIADLTALEFRVTLEDMRARYTGVGGRKAAHPPALVARYVAIWLMRRHTEASLREVADFFQAYHQRIGEIVQAVETWKASVRDISDTIERIERHIDDIHEARLEKEFGPL